MWSLERVTEGAGDGARPFQYAAGSITLQRLQTAGDSAGSSHSFEQRPRRDVQSVPLVTAPHLRVRAFQGFQNLDRGVGFIQRPGSV